MSSAHQCCCGVQIPVPSQEAWIPYILVPCIWRPGLDCFSSSQLCHNSPRIRALLWPASQTVLDIIAIFCQSFLGEFFLFDLSNFFNPHNILITSLWMQAPDGDTDNCDFTSMSNGFKYPLNASRMFKLASSLFCMAVLPILSKICHSYCDLID